MRRVVLGCLALLVACQAKDPVGTLLPQQGSGGAERLALPATLTSGDSPPFRLRGGTYALSAFPSPFSVADPCESRLQVRTVHNSAVVREAVVGTLAPPLNWQLGAGVYVLTMTPLRLTCPFRITLTTVAN